MLSYFRSVDLRGEWNRKNARLLPTYFLTALLLNAVIEVLARRSIDDTVAYAFTRPLSFLYGTAILYCTCCISLLFRKRRFWFLLLCAVWLGLAVTDFILLTYRSMPLTASDIRLMSSVRDIFEKYLSHPLLLLLMLGISAALGAIFFLWIRAKKEHPIFLFGLAQVLLAGTALFGLTVLLLGTGLLDRPSTFHSLPKAYHDNGFVYCFSTSLVTEGVDEPEDYTPDVVDEVLNAQKELPPTETDTPNIVFVQLESFFDPQALHNLTLAQDPVPNFRRLKSSCSTGFLSVPCIGAGTANTEFEVLTGMNLSHFGVGEYPYMTVVNEQVSASIASTLSALGYRTHAIHNNNATFYDRHLVYDNLSFDTFTSLEYMDGVEFNPLGWAKDTVLTDEIVKALESTEERDLVFAVSVQPHGRYPKSPMENVPTIAVSGEADEARKNGLEYYLYQLGECDAFVGELVSALSAFDEPTVVVFYGDHLPSFNIQQEELSRGDTQSTEYVLWSNFDLTKVDRDLQTYHLGAYVLDRCGIHEGVIFRLHQSYGYAGDDLAEYQEALQLLEYDMIDGENYSAEDGETPRATMRFDVEDVVLSEVEAAGEETYLLHGEHFTPYSVAFLNNEPRETEFVSETLLRVTGLSPNAGDALCVAQVSAADSFTPLSRTDDYLWTEEMTDDEARTDPTDILP